MSIKAIVFDFDGVILESVDIKTTAFRELFKGYPEQVDRIVQFHVQNTGISRFEKFKVIYRDFLRLALDEQEMERLGREFSRLVLEEVLRCPFVPGARRFLEKYSPMYPLFVASATPTSELVDIVKRRGMEAFFKDTFGYPPAKAAVLHTLVDIHSWQAEEVLFVGDALNDYSAALEAGVAFVGRTGAGQPNPFPAGTTVVRDLAQLDSLWPSLIGQNRVSL